jgi:hypothetical protein
MKPVDLGRGDTRTGIFVSVVSKGRHGLETFLRHEEDSVRCEVVGWVEKSLGDYRRRSSQSWRWKEGGVVVVRQDVWKVITIRVVSDVSWLLTNCLLSWIRRGAAAEMIQGHSVDIAIRG